MLTLLAASSTLLASSSANPVPLISILERTTNTTSSKTSAWVSDPNTRGTYSLIYSSLSTLSLCAWTAYHPNVREKKGIWSSFSRRAVWMLVAMIFPELVLFCAWEQWWTARRLRKTVNDLLQQEAAELDRPLSSASLKEHKTLPRTISITQAFFLVSGGLAVDASDFWVMSNLTFTPIGIVELARAGILPEISERDIEDRSKADMMTKALTCIQALWFFVSGIGRISQHLPVTLLEIHVMIHVFCAFAMYILWFNKPYNVERPLLASDPRVADMAALFILDDMTRFYCCEDETQTVRDPAMDHWVPYSDIRLAHIHGTIQTRQNAWERTFHEPYGLTLDCTSECWNNEIPLSITGVKKSDKKIQHRRRVNAAITHLSNRASAQLLDPTASSTSPPSPPQPLFFGKSHVVPHRSNMWIDGQQNRALLYGHDHPNDAFFSASLHASMGDLHALQQKALAFLGTCYGGAHLSAWNNEFPSTTEKWLWRVAALCMTSMPVLLLLSYRIARWKMRDEDEGRRRRWVVQWTVDWVFGLAGALLGSAGVGGYILGRPYVLVEGFASLRRPPVGTYVTPSWAGYIPHFG